MWWCTDASICCLHPNSGCLIRPFVLVPQNASRIYASGPGPWEISPASSGMCCRLWHTVTSLDSAGVAWLFLKHVWHHHGLLEEVISDCRPTVGGITVCYGTCLQSLVLWARVCHCDCIILAFHSTYETWQRLVELGGLTLGFSKVFQISL